MSVHDPQLIGSGRPIIGFDNVVPTATLATDTNPAGDFAAFPLSAVKTPDTYTTWIGEFPIFQSPLEFPAAIWHFDGADASVSFLDSSGNSHHLTPNGNVQIDTAQAKFGQSALFDGTGDYLTGDGSADFTFSTGPFTVDFWVRLNTINTQKNLVTIGDLNAVTGFAIYIATNNTLRMFANAADRITGATTLVANQWYHVALTRTGTSTRLFLDGVQQGSTFSDSFSYAASSNSPVIGISSVDLSSAPHNGWMDEIRILKGALWTAAFSVPVSPFDVIDRSIIVTTASALDVINYVGIAGRLAGDQIQIETPPASLAMLLHFEGSNPTDIVDDSPLGTQWTVGGNAHVNYTSRKFGIGALLLDGTTDFIIPNGTPASFASSDFTVDFWYGPNASGTQQVLYDGRPNSVDGAYLTIYRNTSNIINVFTNGNNRISSSTALASGLHHIAVTRSGGTTRLFINGVQEGGNFSDATVYLSVASRPMIGADGSAPGSSSVNGILDEVRVLIGLAAWTSNFTPPTAPYAWTVAVPFASVDGNVSIFRFPPALGSVKIKFRVPSTGSIQPIVQSLYAGEILELEKGVRAEVPHIPISYGRKTNVVNGMSEGGAFIGRIVLSEWRESKAEFFGFTRDFFVTSMVPFLAAAKEIPFFFAYAPTEYPTECGYVWLSKDPEPEILPSTRSYAITLDMRGVA